VRVSEVVRRAASSDARRVRLVVFTDGRANVPLSGANSDEGPARRERIRREILALGAPLSKARVASVVVDTQSRFTADGDGRFLAGALGGAYVRLPQLLAEAATRSFFDE
jgi:Mg-chelatase subunit ChlD